MNTSHSRRVLLLSPYHTGSHQQWAEGYQEHSRHQIDLLTLPGRFWKWRMHGGAVSLADQIAQQKQTYPLLLTTDMLDLTTLQALTPTSRQTASILFMHENQLTYPLPDDPTTGPMRRQRGERDLHYAFINYSSMLAANRIWFNSKYHFQSWFRALPAMLRHFPDLNLPDTPRRLAEKSQVMPVGIHPPRHAPDPERGSKPPTILWNHRWEFDKNPKLFFRTLIELAQEGIDFRVVVCGQDFRKRPGSFEKARRQLGPRVTHWGYADREQYGRLLQEADLVLSTAHHDFFGISIVEAIAYGTFPLLPRRLAYPELIPDEFHAECFYDSDSDLATRLRDRLTDIQQTRILGKRLAPQMNQFFWPSLALRYDEELDKILNKMC